MTTEEFNALPLEARRFIELHAGCLSCGNLEGKLTRAYELYKSQKMANVYTLFGGGINFLADGKGGVLYNVRDTDSPLEIREKLAIAERIHAASPHVFMSYDEKAIEELLESLDAPEVVDLRTDEERAVEVIQLTADQTEEGKAAEAAALEAWAERSALLGIDTKTAEYEDLKAFSAAKELKPESQKKFDLIEAINAIVLDDEDLQ